MPNKQSIRVRRRRRRWWQYLGAKFWYAMAVILFLTFVLYHSRGGLNRNNGQNPSISAERLLAEQETIAQLELDFREHLEDGTVSKDAIAILEEAIRRQSDLLYYLGTGTVSSQEGGDVLQRLIILRDTEAGRLERAISERAELEAAAAAVSGRNEYAMMAYDDAINSQERINRLYGQGPYADRDRLVALRTARQRIEAMPFARKARELESEALLAMSEHRYEEAENLLSLALTQTKRLLQTYRETQLVGEVDLHRLEDLLQEARAGQSQVD